MFKTARLKLTGWYLLIIMIISMAFSLVIYRASVFELRRFAEAQQNRFERRTPPFPTIKIDEELISEANGRIRNSLLIINLGILIFSSTLGYYLSGKTLDPIREMMDEQDRFISDASHELKTPITALRTSMEVSLRDKELASPESKQILNANLADVIRLQKLTEGLLELSKHQPIISEKYSLDQVIGGAIKEVGPLYKAKQIKLKTVLPPNIIVEMDPLAMKRAVVAILDNAIKYSKQKSEVSVILTSNNRIATIKIADKGIGIAQTDIENVTKRFYRSDKARNSKGYGLGLPIAKNIVEMHKGTLNIESKHNNGTMVTITLPFSARIQNTIS